VQLKELRLNNFLSYGEEQILDLSKTGLFLVTGKNEEQAGASSSNGSGKCVRKGTKILTKEMGEVCIEQLCPDAEYGQIIQFEEEINIWTDEGWKLIECFWITEPQDLIEIELEDGKKMCASIDHRVMTQRGWVKLKDLNENDLVVVE